MRRLRTAGLAALVMGAVLGGLGAYVAVLAQVVDPIHLTMAPHLVTQSIGGGLLFAGLVGGPVRALTYDMLARLGNPQEGNQPQALRWIFFDTATITSTVTRSITYFNTARGDKTLSNLQTPGQLNAGQYFEWCYCGFDLHTTTSEAASAAGTLADIQEIMLIQRPTFTVDYNGKNIGPFPLRFLHTSGGAVGSLSTGTQDTVEVGNNNVADGGWNWGGGLVLCPSTGFSVTVDFAAAPTITTGPLQSSFWMEGILSRNVV